MSDFTFPNVSSMEQDISQYIPNMNSSSAAIVVTTPRGSLSRLLITSNQQFRNEYCIDGKVTLGNYSQYSALAYLAQGSTLYVQRVVDTATAKFGGIKVRYTPGTSVALSVGVSSPAFTQVSGEQNLFNVFAKDPGAWSSQLSIVIANVNTGANLGTNCFDIQVWYTTLGGVSSLAETWTVSRLHQVDGYNRQQYLETVINGFSQYIVVKDSTVVNTTLPVANATAIVMGGGVDGTTPTLSQVAGGWSSFLNKDEVDCRILINAGFALTGDQTVPAAMKAVVDARLDCVAVLDTPYGSLDTVAKMLTYDGLVSQDSYTALYAPWGVISDPDNAQLVGVPPSGYVAGAMAYNDSIGEVWDAVAGTDRGSLPFVQLYFGSDTTGKISFTDGELGQLCLAGVNPIRRKTGKGIMIWEQKTGQSYASATDRLNVRRSLIIIESSIKNELEAFLFKNNTEITRFNVYSTLNDYLSRLSARGAFEVVGKNPGFLVVCDLTNNTPATIDANELIVDVYVKPVKTIEYIRYRTIITKSGVNLQALASQGALI